MAFGYSGKVLRVDLSSGSITVEEYGDEFYRTYLGGKGMVGYFLLREAPPQADPFGPDNVLVFAVGPLAGTALAGFSRVVVGAKSPLTSGYGESEVGGTWGAELKRAGFDAIVIRGVSPAPVYLHIENGAAQLMDALDIWGKTTGETEMRIAARAGRRRPAVMSIGPAGERLVRFACIMQGDRNAAGRAGLGAVMGSKRLKAISAAGGDRPQVSDPETLSRITKWFAANYRENAPSVALSETGTAGIVPGMQMGAMLPTRNFSEGKFDGWQDLAVLGRAWTYEAKGRGCFACPVRCKTAFVVGDGSVDTRGGTVAGPEYETIGALGSNLCVRDPLTVLKANVYCNEMGLDTISAGVTMSFVLECIERGILKDKDLDRLGARFGNASCVLPLLEMTVHRRGFGDTMAEGSLRAARRLGNGSEALAMQVKGQELPMHDPRGKVGVALGYALADHGADHMTAAHDHVFTKAEGYGVKTCSGLGLNHPVSALSLGPDKVRLYYYSQMWWDTLKGLGACFFCVAPRGLLPVEMVVDAVQAVTGWNVTLWELLKAGERAGCMARVFNSREGYGAERDSLPSRLFEPNGEGGYPGINSEEFEGAIALYYEMRGWSRCDGAPTKAKLYELGLGWILDPD